MSTKLNLANNPFRNRSLPWTVTTMVTLLCIVLLILIARATYQTKSEVTAAERDVTQLRQQMNELNKRADQINRTLTPEQKLNLKSAHLLVDRKRFSWSQLFADLEAALPGPVRVTRITVKNVFAEGDRTVADLDLVVAGKAAATVTQMISEMESQGVFQNAELVSQNALRGRGESGEEYEISVHYVPRAGFAIERRSDHPVDTAEPKGKR